MEITVQLGKQTTYSTLKICVSKKYDECDKAKNNIKYGKCKLRGEDCKGVGDKQKVSGWENFQEQMTAGYCRQMPHTTQDYSVHSKFLFFLTLYYLSAVDNRLIAVT